MCETAREVRRRGGAQGRTPSALPSRLLMVGCQPVDAETPGRPMSDEVSAAVDVAVREILRHVEELLADAGEQTEAGPAKRTASEIPPEADFLGIGNGTSSRSGRVAESEASA